MTRRDTPWPLSGDDQTVMSEVGTNMCRTALFGGEPPRICAEHEGRPVDNSGGGTTGL